MKKMQGEEVKIVVGSKVMVKDELMDKLEEVLGTVLWDIRGDVEDYINKQCGYKTIGMPLDMVQEIHKTEGIGTVKGMDRGTYEVQFRKGGIWRSIKKKDIELYIPASEPF